MKLGIWRRGPSLGLHETTFRESTIDETMLPDLTLMMRLYAPRAEAIEGGWQPPPIQRVH